MISDDDDSQQERNGKNGNSSTNGGSAGESSQSSSSGAAAVEEEDDDMPSPENVEARLDCLQRSFPKKVGEESAKISDPDNQVFWYQKGYKY